MMMTEYVCAVICIVQELEARRFPQIGAPRPGIRELVQTTPVSLQVSSLLGDTVVEKDIYVYIQVVQLKTW